MTNEIPINKGNYSSMEPPEREEQFNRYRAEGWEDGYYQYRENWSKWPQKKILAEYPLEIDAELSNICNLNCPMCFRRKEEYQQKEDLQFMEFSLFTKIIDEIGSKVPALRLSLRGESTLHPQILDCIRYAKKSGLKEISFLTNCSKMTPDFFEKIVLAGADWITISIDGLAKEYEKVRAPLRFEDTFKKIREMKKVKEKLGRHRPVIKIQSIWPAISESPEKFYNLFVPYVDLIAFNPLIDYLGLDDKTKIEHIDNFYCPQHYQRLIIGADGRAIMCTNDEENSQYIGNANNESIAEIWHGTKLNTLREIHKTTNGYKKIPVCNSCFLPRKTEAIETFVVNQRRFVVHNYVNRSQSIGS